MTSATRLKRGGAGRFPTARAESAARVLCFFAARCARAARAKRGARAGPALEGFGSPPPEN